MHNVWVNTYVMSKDMWSLWNCRTFCQVRLGEWRGCPLSWIKILSVCRKHQPQPPPPCRLHLSAAPLLSPSNPPPSSAAYNKPYSSWLWISVRAHGPPNHSFSVQFSILHLPLGWAPKLSRSQHSRNSSHKHFFMTIQGTTKWYPANKMFYIIYIRNPKFLKLLLKL